MIARRWRVWTSPDRVDELQPYLRRTGVGEALATPGSRGALLLRGEERDGEIEFTLITLWDDLDAIVAFAGEDPGKAVTYPEDERFFTRCDERVEHLDVAAHDGLR